MRGTAARSITLLVLAALAFAATASAGAGASPARAPILGVVPHIGGPAPTRHASAKAAAKAAEPTSLTFDANYESLLNRYFADVAHDSGGPNNVYSVATQYFDGSGHIQYSSTFGGSYVDKDPLPPNGCSDGVDAYCLSNQQLQSEIQTVLTARGWHGGLDHVFFLLTPNGVGSCFDAVGTECSTNVFCAYHSAFVDSNQEDVIYANEPYEGPTAGAASGCTGPDQGFPNDTNADTTINTISHEHNEAITDPFGDAWVANDRSEIGDLCAYGFGAALGGTGGGVYNQMINAHHYDLQEEWSNAAGGCVQKLGGTPSPPTFGNGPLVYTPPGLVMHTNTTYAIYWLPTAGSASPPVVTGTLAANRHPQDVARRLDRRTDRLRLSVAALLLDRGELREHRGCDGSHVQAHDGRRWPHRALDGARDQRERPIGFRALGDDLFRRRGRSPDRPEGAAHLGPGASRQEAVRQSRLLDVLPHRLSLPVAAL